MNTEYLNKWKKLDEILEENDFRIIYNIDGEIHNYGSDLTLDRFEYNVNNDTLTIYNHFNYEIECIQGDSLNEFSIKHSIELSLDGNIRFQRQIKEIQELEENWDNYGACQVSKNIIGKTSIFVEKMPWKFKNKLDAEDGIYPNPNGTITIEWRDENSVASVEIGINPLYVFYRNIDVKDWQELFKYTEEFNKYII